MANSSEDVDAALAGMAQVGSPREPMGTTAIDTTYFASANTGNQHLMPRGNVQSGEPTISNKANRPQVMLGADRLGAKYTVFTNLVQSNAPEAGATQASGRIVKPSTNRSRGGFDDAMGSSYL